MNTKLKSVMRQWPLLCFFVLCVPLLSSCDDDHWRIERYLNGTWQSNDDYHSVYTIDFYRDGYGRIESRYNGMVEYRDRFDWWADDYYIYVRYDSDGYSETWAYDTDRKGQLYIEGIDGGGTIRFVRWD